MTRIDFLRFMSGRHDPSSQEYPTEPLDKIPALQVEFELAGKKKTLANWLAGKSE